MSRHICLLIFCSTLLFYAGNAQNSFEITYNTSADELIWDAKVDVEGAVILVGNYGSLESLFFNALVIKVFPDGSYIYKQFDDPEIYSSFGSIDILDNGNYLLTGCVGENVTMDECDMFWCVFLDNSLNVLNTKSFAIPADYLNLSSDRVSLIDNNGNIAMVGLVGRLDGQRMVTDYYAIKLNQQGDTLLTRVYESWPESRANSISKLPNSDSLMLIGGGALLSGSESVNIMDKDMNITRISGIENDNSEWTCYSPGLWLNDSEFLASINRIYHEDMSSEYQFAVYKINTSGEYLDELVLDRRDTLEYVSRKKGMAFSADSMIFVSGFQSYNQLWTDIPSKPIVYMVDKHLNLLGRKELGGDAYYDTWGTVATPDGGCMIYGTRYINTGAYERDIHIWKLLREDFEIITSVEDYPISKIAAKAWPNPADDLLHISIEGLETGQDFRLRIYNTTGQKYLDKAHTVCGNAVQCRIDVLTPGTYVYEIQTVDGQAGSGKFIKR